MYRFICCYWELISSFLLLFQTIRIAAATTTAPEAVAATASAAADAEAAPDAEAAAAPRAALKTAAT